MKNTQECEITIEVDSSLDELINILTNNGLKIIWEYDLNDIYMIPDDKRNVGNNLQRLGNCVILRHRDIPNNELFQLVHKYKEYNEKNEIIKQIDSKCEIKNIESAKMFFESIGYSEFIKIDDHIIVCQNSEDEFVIQCVNGKHIYIEIEQKCHNLKKSYSGIQEMKNVINKYKIPMKGIDYFVKKAEIEIIENGL